MNPETAVTCTRGLFNQVVCAVIQLSIVNTLIALRTNYHTVHVQQKYNSSANKLGCKVVIRIML